MSISRIYTVRHTVNSHMFVEEIWVPQCGINICKWNGWKSVPNDKKLKGKGSFMVNDTSVWMTHTNWRMTKVNALLIACRVEIFDGYWIFRITWVAYKIKLLQIIELNSKFVHMKGFANDWFNLTYKSHSVFCSFKTRTSRFFRQFLLRWGLNKLLWVFFYIKYFNCDPTRASSPFIIRKVVLTT